MLVVYDLGQFGPFEFTADTVVRRGTPPVLFGRNSERQAIARVGDAGWPESGTVNCFGIGGFSPFQ